jgi:hypothetical protein
MQTPKLFAAVKMTDGTIAVFCGPNPFVTFYDEVIASTCAIKLNEIVETWKESETLAAPSND